MSIQISLKSLLQKEGVTFQQVFKEEPLILKKAFYQYLPKFQEEIADLNAVIGQNKEPVDVRVLPNKLKLAGYGNGAVISPKDAQMFFDSGLTVWVRSLNHLRFYRELRQSLLSEVSTDKLYSQLFISPSEAKTLRHFDDSSVLIMQLKGKKEWTIAPYDIAKFGIPKDESDLMPEEDEMPNQQRFILEPGDCFFLPKYWWHNTKSIEDSWSISSFF